MFRELNVSNLVLRGRVSAALCDIWGLAGESPESWDPRIGICKDLDESDGSSVAKSSLKDRKAL